MGHLLSIGLAATLAATACGGAVDDTREAATGGSSPTTLAERAPRPTEPPAPPATGGWLGGEPDWSAAAEGGEEYAAAEPADRETGPAVALGAAADDAEAMPVEDVAPDEPADTSPLRAGSVDDNADFTGFLAYLERIRGLGIALRPFDPTGRVVVEVNGSDGRPVPGATVTVGRDGETVATIATTADGSARFLPALYDQPVDATYTFSAGDVSAESTAAGTVELVLATPGGVAGAVPLDVLFLLDATGSMSDEIGRLKTSIDSVAARVAALEGAPDVRFAMTLYRDEGDVFVTRSYDFTSDVEAFRDALADVVADGGGDYPEALDEGLAEALGAPSWREPAGTVQLVFLVADAPPQVARQVATPYPQSIRDAIARGIKVFPVASSESDDQAEAVFRQIAQATGARFVFLTYGAGGAATGGSTDIDRTDYEELALDDLVVRLVAEEVAALTGGAVPPPTPTTTTIPDGQ